MSEVGTRNEPSMEEILASIRRIITEEPESGRAATGKAPGRNKEDGTLGPLAAGAADAEFELPNILRPQAAAPERQPTILNRLADALRGNGPGKSGTAAPAGTASSLEDDLADLIESGAAENSVNAIPPPPPLPEGAEPMVSQQGQQGQVDASSAQRLLASLDQSLAVVNDSAPGAPPLDAAPHMGVREPQEPTKAASASARQNASQNHETRKTGMKDENGIKRAASLLNEARRTAGPLPQSANLAGASESSEDVPRFLARERGGNSGARQASGPATSPAVPLPPVSTALGAALTGGAPRSEEPPRKHVAVDSLASVPGASVPGAASRGSAPGGALDVPAAPSAKAGQRTLEEIAAALLQPLLQQWAAENLPRLAEQILREEIRRSPPFRRTE